MRTIEFELRGDYITLDALLKVTGLASSGGEGKAMVADGKVEVDGRQELRKACKIRAGQVVGVLGARIRIHAPTMPAPLGGEDRPHDPDR
ncbi:MAG TPA: RNA-binding S4 domain-containing protein [Rhizobacter sp.]|nr:RNA-binding S4 domain-containing protein [Rhizobacter sp.]